MFSEIAEIARVAQRQGQFLQFLKTQVIFILNFTRKHAITNTYNIQGKIFVKARHLKRQSASRVKTRTPWKLQKCQLLLNIQNR